MNKKLAQVFSILVGGLAVVGLFISGHLLNLMNVDIAIDMTRVVLAAMLMYAAFISNSDKTLDRVLGFVGILYIGMGVLGLVDSKLFGLLPSGLNGFDIAFHLLSGALATWVALGRRSHTNSNFTAARSH